MDPTLPIDLKFYIEHVDSSPTKPYETRHHRGFQLNGAKPFCGRHAHAPSMRASLSPATGGGTQQRKRLPLEDKVEKKREVQNAGKFRQWTRVSRSCTESSALHANDRVVEAQSIVNPSSSHLLCNCRRHRARLGSMASRIYLLFGRSSARPLFAPLGFESMLV